MNPSAPLAGVRVLDFGTLLPVPFATQVLADLGATVVKVERPGTGDPLREYVPAMFTAVNRGKHSIAADLKDPGDVALLLDLVETADVVVEGFRPGVMDRLGLGFTALAERNPRLVHLSINGWGGDGPASGEAAHNENILATAGATHLTRTRTAPPTDAFPIPVADLSAALYSVIAILAALRDPDRTAQHLETPLIASTLAFMTPRLAEYLAKPEESREFMMSRPANGVYATGGGGHVVLVAVENHFWTGLCAALGRPDLAARPELAGYQGRFAAEREIAEAIEAALAPLTRDEAVSLLRAHGVPCTPVLRPDEITSDPQVRHLDLLPDWPDVRAFLPVRGLAVRSAGGVPGLDADGEVLRAGGWPSGVG